MREPPVPVSAALRASILARLAALISSRKSTNDRFRGNPGKTAALLGAVLAESSLELDGLFLRFESNDPVRSYPELRPGAPLVCLDAHVSTGAYMRPVPCQVDVVLAMLELFVSDARAFPGGANEKMRALLQSLIRVLEAADPEAFAFVLYVGIIYGYKQTLAGRQAEHAAETGGAEFHYAFVRLYRRAYKVVRGCEAPELEPVPLALRAAFEAGMDACGGCLFIEAADVVEQALIALLLSERTTLGTNGNGGGTCIAMSALFGQLSEALELAVDSLPPFVPPVGLSEALASRAAADRVTLEGATQTGLTLSRALALLQAAGVPHNAIADVVAEQCGVDCGAIEACTRSSSDSRIRSIVASRVPQMIPGLTGDQAAAMHFLDAAGRAAVRGEPEECRGAAAAAAIKEARTGSSRQAAAGSRGAAEAAMGFATSHPNVMTIGGHGALPQLAGVTKAQFAEFMRHSECARAQGGGGGGLAFVELLSFRVSAGRGRHLGL